MVTADRSLVLKRKIFSTLRLYTGFLGQRKRTDELVCDTMQKRRKLKILKDWTRVYSQRVGARVFVQCLTSSEKRLTFQ